MIETIEIYLGNDALGKRLDQSLIKALGDQFSRARLQAMIKGGALVAKGSNQAITQPAMKLKNPLALILTVPAPESAEPEPEDIPLDIVYEDEGLLVVNKAVGMVVHPGAGNWSGTLVNALLNHCKGQLSGVGGVERPGIVHRLDKETSGLMIVAKNDQAHRFLSAQLEDRSLKRTYEALVWGMPVPMEGRIEGNIGRHPKERQKMAMVPQGGREAITDYKVQESYLDGVLSLVECRLQTGRTHQIRVHMAAHQYWLVGDPLYGRQTTSGRAALKKTRLTKDQIEQVLAFPRQALHAKSLKFIHPRSKKKMILSSDLPADLDKLLAIASEGNALKRE